MKSRLIFCLLLIIMMFTSCKRNYEHMQVKILFLHHSTGGIIWKGNPTISKIEQVAGKISDRVTAYSNKKAQLPILFKQYNRKNNTNYVVNDLHFPKGPTNDPYDYYNIWVRNADTIPFQENPTLEILTREIQVIIFKHCFPISNIQIDMDSADVKSEYKSISNYQLQYNALREKLHQFPTTKFILFTGAALVKSAVTEDEAQRAKEFFSWVIEEWDIPNDNIYLWDLYNLQTRGDLYFNDENAVSSDDSHPNKVFAGEVSPLLFNRIIDVIENEGKGTLISGEKVDQ